MRAPVPHCINQDTKFELPSFTNSKDMIGGQNSKTVHVTLTTPRLLVVCQLAYRTVYTSRSRDSLSLGAQNVKMSHLTPTTPLLIVICRPYAGTSYSLPVYKIGSSL